MFTVIVWDDRDSESDEPESSLGDFYTYECVICLSINHASRLHCQHCGTIPARYSMIGREAKPASHCWYIPVIAAFGVSRASQRRSSRVYFRTVRADYYAE